MPTAPIIHPGYPALTELEEVNSTNIYAVDRVQANMAGHGSAFFAHRQTGGKGQRGKIWLSPAGANILLSVVLDMAFMPVPRQFPLSMAIALAGHDLFSRYAGEETHIKWPNDIYWRDRKAGGILIDNIIGAAAKPLQDPDTSTVWKWAVAGIGMNINQTVFPDELSKAVSLQQVTGRQFDVIVLVKELCGYVEKRYEQLRTAPVQQLLDEYNDRLYGRHREVRLKKENAVFTCRVEGVNATGELLVSGAAADQFTFGEVEWIIP